MDTQKLRIMEALDKWTRQRPGLEFGNYGDISSYRSEVRSITRDLHDYRQLARRVELSSVTGDNLKAALSRRLIWDGEKLSYVTGQYWPTEYRKAAASALASVLWDYVRDRCMPAPEYVCDGKTFPDMDSARAYAETLNPVIAAIEERYAGLSAGDWLRRYFRREFGRGIASRYFT